MNFLPTDAPAGTPEKLEVLRQRAKYLQELFHPDDRRDYNGITGGIITAKHRKAERPGKISCGVKMSAGRKMLSE